MLIWETKIKNELKDNIKKIKMEMKMIPEENTDTKNSVKCSYLLVARYRQSLVDLVVLIKQGMSKSTD